MEKMNPAKRWALNQAIDPLVEAARWLDNDIASDIAKGKIIVGRRPAGDGDDALAWDCAVLARKLADRTEGGTD